MFKKLCSPSSSPTCVTVPLWGGQRSAPRHQRRDADARGPQRPPGPPTGCSGCVWESPGWQRWLWLAAPPWTGRPSGGRAARASGAGSRQRTCRLWWTPASGRKSPSANTEGDETVIHMTTRRGMPFYQIFSTQFMWWAGDWVIWTVSTLYCSNCILHMHWPFALCSGWSLHQARQSERKHECFLAKLLQNCRLLLFWRTYHLKIVHN